METNSNNVKANEINRENKKVDKAETPSKGRAAAKKKQTETLTKGRTQEEIRQDEYYTLKSLQAMKKDMIENDKASAKYDDEFDKAADSE